MRITANITTTTTNNNNNNNNTIIRCGVTHQVDPVANASDSHSEVPSLNNGLEPGYS